MPWKIQAYGEKGNPVEIRSFSPQSEAEDFRTRDVLAAVEGALRLDPERFPLHLLRGEVELGEKRGGLPWSDPIHRWGRLLQDSRFSKTERYGEVTFDGQALVWRSPKAEGLCTVTHAPTFVVFAVTPEIEELEIAWYPHPFELPRKLRDLPRNPGYIPAHVFFDTRAYFGRHSSVSDGFFRALASARDMVYRVKLKIKKKLGFVTIKACLHMGGVGVAIPTDPSREARLARLASEYPDHTKLVPDLEPLINVKGRSAVIFVHGTASCGLVSVATFDPAKLRHDKNWYRFEHDTFLSIDDNATELAAKIKSRLYVERLLLVGHSRGGLVARAAAEELRDREVHVWTFGTPHLGTPLVQAVEGGRRIVEFGRGVAHIPEQAMGLLLRIGCRIASAIPLPDVQTAAWSFFLADRELPVGFSDMAEGSGWLRGVNRFDPVSRRVASPKLQSAQKNNDPWPDGAGREDGWYVGKNYLRTYGGKFDSTASKKAGYELMAGSLFGPQDNDLVVSVHSATLGKNYRILANITHFDYFDDGTVQSDIDGF